MTSRRGALLGPRRSSVFPAPVRAVLERRLLRRRPARCRARACGKGISKQLYNILDKIRAVDALQSPRLQDQLFEMGPELSFAELTGRPMPANKRTAEGRAAREQALASASAFGETVRGILDAPAPRRSEAGRRARRAHRCLDRSPPRRGPPHAARRRHRRREACGWRSSPDSGDPISGTSPR